MIELQAGDLTLGLLPSIGGSVSHFRLGAVDLMRPPPAESFRQEVRHSAMFPMLPYANRIAGNEFAYDGRFFCFKANNLPEPYNVHGTGWLCAWDIEYRKANEAVLVLDHLERDEPYSYRASLHFILSESRLTVTTTLTNCGAYTMPFGFGLHPFFQRVSGVTIKFHAAQFWMEGPDGITTELLKTPPELDFSSGRNVPSTWRNNDYCGWDGTAEILSPVQGFGLHIQADPVFRHLVLYADPVKSSFCLEPQTNAVCAFNRTECRDETDLGIIDLQPGASATGSVNFIPFAL